MYFIKFTDIIIGTGTTECKHEVINNILKMLEFGKRSKMYFKYNGIEVVKEEKRTRIYQAPYVSEITEIELYTCRPWHSESQGK